MKKIGLLALQGAFAEHVQTLEKLGAKTFEIRKKEDLLTDSLDGVILPGGESTVMGKLLLELGLFQPLKQMFRDGLPAMGTCAGLILLAKEIVNDDQVYFGLMDISVRRNAYGRQLGSFSANAPFHGLGEIPMTFIRAPYIVKASDNVQALARVDGHIVAARQKNMLVTSFHPELTDDTRVHELFLSFF